MEGELRPSKCLPSLLLAEQTMQRLLADGAVFSTPASRRSANYQPSIWDDSYIQSLPDASLDATQVNLWEKLNEEVRHLIDHNKQKDTIELLENVNTLCQLGISYHFESEIKNVLTFIASSMESLSNILKNSLHGSALLFRLLKEYGIKALNTRWKIKEIQSLPNCMKTTLIALINTMNDIACAFSKEKGLDILPQLKRAWGDQCKAYLVEAIWYNTRYTPTLNEYMENAWLSMAVSLVQTIAYLLSEDLTKEALNSLEFYFDVTRYSSMITRLYDDLGTSTDELQRGDVPKSVQCYMNETNVSEFVARDHIRQLIKKYWKLLNGEYFSNFNLEESFKRCVLNLPRMSQCIYQYGDGYGKPDRETKDRIISSLIKPIPL